MRLEVLATAASVAERAAAWLAAAARAAVTSRGRCAIALSGGRTPWPMLEALRHLEVPWASTHLFQVDERFAPADHPARNLTSLRRSLLAVAALPPGNVHAMPVEDPDRRSGAARYVRELERVAGTPPVLDVVHLGLGVDGHTASLVPGDPAPVEQGKDVAVTGPHDGWMRMTLTFPVLDRSRAVLWLVTGEDKAGVLARLVDGDRSIPAGRVRADRALVIADRAAAAGLAARGRRRIG